ncbi:MAG: hypothetical protein ABSD50_16565 [Smithella sp.]
MIEKILKKAKAKKASIDRTSDEYLFDKARKAARKFSDGVSKAGIGVVYNPAS